MQYLLIPALVITMSLGMAYGQQDNSETLGVQMANYAPYHYVEPDGHTVILGEIINTNDFPVTNIKLWAGFFNEINLQPLESTVTDTALEVIPPNGRSPYMIRSLTPDPDISRVSVSLLGFNSAGEKKQLLSLGPLRTSYTDELKISGDIVNDAGTAQDTRIHLVVYDSFTPPRTIMMESVNVTLTGGESGQFGFSADVPEQARKFAIFAESDNLSGNVLAMDIARPDIITRRATINNVVLIDESGNVASSVETDTTVRIQSDLSFEVSAGQTYNQPYVYYAVVYSSGDPYVEFIGVSEGRFVGTSDTASVTWTPQNSGLYYIQTYIWDPDAVPLGSKGQQISLILVK